MLTPTTDPGRRGRLFYARRFSSAARPTLRRLCWLASILFPLASLPCWLVGITGIDKPDASGAISVPANAPCLSPWSGKLMMRHIAIASASGVFLLASVVAGLHYER